MVYYIQYHSLGRAIITINMKKPGPLVPVAQVVRASSPHTKEAASIPGQGTNKN